MRIGLSLSSRSININIGLLNTFIDIICVWRLSKEWGISLISVDWLITLCLLNYKVNLHLSAQKSRIIAESGDLSKWKFCFSDLIIYLGCIIITRIIDIIQLFWPVANLDYFYGINLGSSDGNFTLRFCPVQAEIWLQI